MAPINSISTANETLLLEMMQAHLDNKERRAYKCHLSLSLSRLPRSGTEAIYWITAALVMVLVIVVARTYSVTQADYSESKNEQTDSEERAQMTDGDLEKLKEKHVKIARRCLTTTLCCFGAAIGLVFLQALDILALQWCHEEPLVGFYWPIWTLIGVGSCIAMLGVIISQTYSLRGHEPPSYTVALGTPVLVASASGDFVKAEFDALRQKIKDKKNGQKGKTEKSPDEEPINQGDPTSRDSSNAPSGAQGEAGDQGAAGAQQEPESEAVGQSQAAPQTVASPNEKI